jgi:hypothetical protein
MAAHFRPRGIAAGTGMDARGGAKLGIMATIVIVRRAARVDAGARRRPWRKAGLSSSVSWRNLRRRLRRAGSMRSIEVRRTDARTIGVDGRLFSQRAAGRDERLVLRVRLPQFGTLFIKF